MEERLKKLSKIAIKQCKECNIPIDEKATVKINTRATKRYGVCRRQNGTFQIEISKFLFESTDDKILQTILHEYIHTCKNCFNHGNQWKVYANKLNKKYNYSISRTNSRTEMGLENFTLDDYKYILRCSNPKCNIICLKRMRMSPIIKNYKNYQCKRCGSKLIREK